MGKFNNLQGKTFNGLEVLERIGVHPTSGTVMWKTKCLFCGTVKVIRSDSIQFQNRGCGCQNGPTQSLHGLSQIPLYNVWKNIIDRCQNPKNKGYKSYGGRGITVCEEWLGNPVGLDCFYRWSLQNGYIEGLTIERLDVNGNYEPGNCTWITPEEQAQNKTTTRWVCVEGRKVSLSAAVREHSTLKYTTVFRRIKAGWKPMEALTSPLQRNLK